MPIHGEPLKRDQENPPADEAASIDQVVRASDAILRLGNGPVLRGQHAKGTAAVRAKFVVDSDRPKDTRFGLFEETRTYEAIVRFSNGRGLIKPDQKKDARGMAIKVLGVSGPRALDEAGDESTQDFVMINHPVFPFKNAAEYAKFMSLKSRLMSRLGAIGNEVAQVMFMIVPWRWRQLLIGTKLKRESTSPLLEQYWSMSAYRLGSRAIKFTASPQESNSASLPRIDENLKQQDDFLFQVTASQLRQREARFDFLVQFQLDPIAMPIEDPTFEWDAKASPFMKVATVILENVDLTSPESLEFRKACEALSFNPWHSLLAHMPLGGINRLRKAVYQSNAKMRRQTAERL